MTDGKAAGKTRDEIAAAYDSPPWWYDVRGFFILTFAYNSTITRQLAFFGPNFGPKHLELACGTGTMLDLLLRWRRWKRLPEVQILGADYAESMLAGAERRFSGRRNIELLHADAAALPCPSDSFDTVNLANAIHCLPDVEGALREVRRVLKPGATFATNALLYPRGVWPFKQIATRLDEWGMRKGILYTPFHADEVRRHVSNAGLEIVREHIAGNCLDVLARKPR
jgi:ubiquinone/menaquinone biosynthesis C-methylase UbiE